MYGTSPTPPTPRPEAILILAMDAGIHPWSVFHQTQVTHDSWVVWKGELGGSMAAPPSLAFKVVDPCCSSRTPDKVDLKIILWYLYRLIPTKWASVLKTADWRNVNCASTSYQEKVKELSLL